MDAFDGLVLAVSVAIGWCLHAIARAWQQRQRSQGERRRQVLERMNRER
jgi:hypothetical protein